MKQIALKYIQGVPWINTQGVSESMGGQVFLCGWRESRQLISTLLALFKGQNWGIFFPGEECSLERQCCLTDLALCSGCPSKTCGDLLWSDNKSR